MSIDPQHSLQLAFQHLDTFSVPGVGTLKRTYFGAVIDHQQKKILPPAERFVLVKGEAHEEGLVQFYFRFLELKIDRARELVQEVGDYVREELKKAGSLMLPGWGEFRDAEGQDIAFVHESGMLAVGDQFFGLQPVGYTLGEAMVADEGKKEAATIAGHESNTTRVEPPKPPRKKRRGWIFLLLLLLLLGSGAGIIWPDKFMGMLDKIGLVSDDNGTITANDKPDAKDPDVIPPDTAASKNLEPDLVDPVQPTDVPETDSGDKPGEFAIPGTYYLIVSATSSGDDAKDLLSSFRKGGAQPSILKSRGRGFYKISVFHSTNKDDVIAKMVEWKDTFPGGSWIYWTGM